MFGFVRRWRRRRIASRPFPSEWRTILEENVGHVAWLDEGERARLESAMRIVIAEKNWEGCNGFTLTDEVRVTVAGQACLLLLGFEDSYFDRLASILVYPDRYVAPEKRVRAGGILVEGFSERLGEASHTGAVVLSWPDVLDGGRFPTSGRNLVWHEFAHVLDAEDLAFNGAPALLAKEHHAAWHEVMSREHRLLIEAAEAGRFTLLDRYGAESEAEFFAVATECFFGKPRQLASRQPQLYDVLRAFYRQDPATRVPG